MYVSINSAAQFMDEFDRMGRGNQFSYEALEWLFDYYDEFYDCELDVVEICCDWTEYESEEEACEEHDVEDLDELRERTMVIELDSNRVLVQNY